MREGECGAKSNVPFFLTGRVCVKKGEFPDECPIPSPPNNHQFANYTSRTAQGRTFDRAQQEQEGSTSRSRSTHVRYQREDQARFDF